MVVFSHGSAGYRLHPRRGGTAACRVEQRVRCARCTRRVCKSSPLLLVCGSGRGAVHGGLFPRWWFVWRLCCRLPLGCRCLRGGCLRACVAGSVCLVGVPLLWFWSLVRCRRRRRCCWLGRGWLLRWQVRVCFRVLCVLRVAKVCCEVGCCVEFPWNGAVVGCLLGVAPCCGS